MGVTERREREKKQRRNEIIDAAEHVFFSRGLDVATMDDVARAAELSKGTLYLYFKNKEDLYLAVLARGMEILKDKFESAVAAEETGLAKIASLGRAYFEFGRSHPDYFNAMLHFESSKSPTDSDAGNEAACHHLSDQLFEITANAVRTGVEDGSIRHNVDPVTIALTLYGLSTGLMQIVALKGPMIEQDHGRDPSQLIETFFELIENSLRAGVIQ